MESKLSESSGHTTVTAAHHDLPPAQAAEVTTETMEAATHTEDSDSSSDESMFNPDVPLTVRQVLMMAEMAGGDIIGEKVLLRQVSHDISDTTRAAHLRGESRRLTEEVLVEAGEQLLGGNDDQEDGTALVGGNSEGQSERYTIVANQITADLDNAVELEIVGGDGPHFGDQAYSSTDQDTGGETTETEETSVDDGASGSNESNDEFDDEEEDRASRISRPDSVYINLMDREELDEYNYETGYYENKVFEDFLDYPKHWLKEFKNSGRKETDIDAVEIHETEIKMAHLSFQKVGIPESAVFELDMDSAARCGIAFNYGCTEDPYIEVFVDVNATEPFRASVFLHPRYATHEICSYSNKDFRTQGSSTATLWSPPLEIEHEVNRHSETQDVPASFIEKVLHRERNVLNSNHDKPKTIHTLSFEVEFCFFDYNQDQLEEYLYGAGTSEDNLRTIRNLMFIQNLFYQSDEPFKAKLHWSYLPAQGEDLEQGLAHHLRNTRICLHYINHTGLGAATRCVFCRSMLAVSSDE